VRQNLDPYAEFEDGSIVQALEDVELYTVISEKGGLDARLEKDMFSHGQRQLFSIARAIVRRQKGGKLLILDEVTSRYDPTPTLLIWITAGSSTKYIFSVVWTNIPRTSSIERF
jgi:ATP-binding cassette subfamily C (CFTR/MRP) protein 1